MTIPFNKSVSKQIQFFQKCETKTDNLQNRFEFFVTKCIRLMRNDVDVGGYEKMKNYVILTFKKVNKLNIV